MTARLNTVGDVPDSNDSFKTWVTAGRISSEQSNKRDVGIGSRVFAWNNNSNSCHFYSAVHTHFYLLLKDNIASVTLQKKDNLRIQIFQCRLVHDNNEYLERLTRTGPKRLHVL